MNAKVGIAPHSLSNKKALVYDSTVPTKTLQSQAWSRKKQILIYAGIPIGIILSIFFFILVWPRIWKLIKDPPKTNYEKNDSNLLTVFVTKND